MTKEFDTPQAVDQPNPVASSHRRRVFLPNTFISLRHRNFQLYFGGQLISVAGTWMQIIAQGWLVYQISHSELILGVVGFAAAIPALVVSPWGGVIVDRVPKRSLLVITQAAMMLLAFILAWLSFSQLVQVWHIILLAACLGLVNAFDGPARQAFVVEMVGREDLTNAIALNSMMFNSARVIGPALGGFLLAAFGAAWCFFLNGLSFLFVIAGLLLMRLPDHRKRLDYTSPWKELMGGIRYSFSHPEIIGLILLALILSFFGISYMTILPAFVDQVLHQNAAGFGWVNAAMGLGAVSGALVIANNSAHGAQGRWLRIANFAFPFLLMAFALNAWFPLSLGLAYFLGIGFMLQFTLINTLLQTNVTDEMRGRVLSLYTVTFFGFAPFGNLLIGWLAEAWGLHITVFLSALTTLLLSIAVFRWIPVLRKLP